MKIIKQLYIYNVKVDISKKQNNQKRDDLKNMHKTFKRFMFKKGDSTILKKSGEIMINTSIKSETPFLSAGTRLNSLIIPAITNTNYINRALATCVKIKKNYTIELKES